MYREKSEIFQSSMTCGYFPQLQIQVLEQMSSNFQSIRRPGTVAKSFVNQEIAEKKLLL